MVLIANVIWFLFCGLWLGLSWIMLGIAFFCTIVGIPYGIASFRIAEFAFFPFGKDIAQGESAGVCTFLLNLIWIVFAGIWLWIASVASGILWFCTIVGIPFGIACFRIAKVSFAPLGKRVVLK